MANKNLFIVTVGIGVAIAFWSFSFTNISTSVTGRADPAVPRILIPKDSILLNVPKVDSIESPSSKKIFLRGFNFPRKLLPTDFIIVDSSNPCKLDKLEEEYLECSLDKELAIGSHSIEARIQGMKYDGFFETITGGISKSKTKKKKLILGWNEILISGWERIKEFDNCPISECEFSFDRNRVEEADAVILYTPHFWNYSVKPSYRRPDQVWIMYSIESPFITKNMIKDVHFNWTMTYRRDADASFLYEKDPPIKPGPVTKKNGTVMWMGYNCHDTQNMRSVYLSELMKHIHVHSFGLCLHTEDFIWLDGKQLKPAGRMGYLWPQNDEVYRAFKFYLSFENANCIDYVTEKFWNPLRLGAVPVVMGAPNIEDFEPYPGSIVKASDFPNPKALAEYLELVANNEKLYEKFHRWRTMPFDQLNPKYQELVLRRPACQLCAKLHAPITPKTIKDEEVWSTDLECEKTRTKWNF